MEQTVLLQRLQELADPAYRTFMARLIPTVPSASVLGVRTPACASLPKNGTGQMKRVHFFPWYRTPTLMKINYMCFSFPWSEIWTYVCPCLRHFFLIWTTGPLVTNVLPVCFKNIWINCCRAWKVGSVPHIHTRSDSVSKC